MLVAGILALVYIIQSRLETQHGEYDWQSNELYGLHAERI